MSTHPVNLHFGCFWGEADIERLQKAELSSSLSRPSRRPSTGSITTATCRWAIYSEHAQSAQGLDQAKFQMKAVATKRIIFFGTKSEKGRARFHSAGPETFAMVDGRWSAVTQRPAPPDGEKRTRRDDGAAPSRAWSSAGRQGRDVHLGFGSW
jgi:hypothetical protein